MPRHLRLCAVVFAATVALLTLLDFASGRAGPAGKKIALVVGINKYHHGGLGELQFAEADAKDLADLLKKAGYEVTLLTGDKATLPAIRAKLTELRKLPGADGLFLVALAGHGMQPADAQESYFIPYDADQRVLKPDEKDKFPWDEKTLLPLSEVLGHLQASSAGARALLVDACRNDPSSGRGRGVGTGLKFADLPKNTAVLLSCSENQRAYEDKAWGGGHGAFFYQVLEGLKGQAADKRGRVTANRLYEHLNDTVPDEVAKVVQAKQKPFQFISGDVDLGIDPKTTETVQELPKTLTLKLGDGVEMELVLLNAKGNAEFLIGSPQDEKERNPYETQFDAEKQHKVTLTKPFYLAKYPVTQEQYEKLIGKNPSYFSKSGYGKAKVQGMDTSRFPVEQVSWDDAKTFCEKLMDKHGGQMPAVLRKQKYRFALPTEAQWEYACRAGTSTPFYFGSELNGKQANCDGNFPYGTRDTGPSKRRTTKVGEYGENKFGLCDMHGNVYQWCQDYYGPYDLPAKDPLRSVKYSEECRVLRGGSWLHNARHCRAAYRLDVAPGRCVNDAGFRVAFRLD
jgi:formylglycine-generating enzyme required for sulfatase activity